MIIQSERLESVTVEEGSLPPLLSFGYLSLGLIVVWLVLGVINMLAFLPGVSGVAMQIRESPILSFLNRYNLVMKGLSLLVARALQ